MMDSKDNIRSVRPRKSSHLRANWVFPIETRHKCSLHIFNQHPNQGYSRIMRFLFMASSIGRGSTHVSWMPPRIIHSCPLALSSPQTSSLERAFNPSLCLTLNRGKKIVSCWWCVMLPSEDINCGQTKYGQKHRRISYDMYINVSCWDLILPIAWLGKNIFRPYSIMCKT